MRRPIVWVADEMPVTGQTDELFSVLVVGELDWNHDPSRPVLQLRVARAMPDRTIAAWTLVFDELARVPGQTDEIWPDFIVADGAAAIARAAKDRFGGRARWVPSTWHLASRIREAYLGKKAPRRGLTGHEIEDHINLLVRNSSALASDAGWRSWWDRLGTLVRNKTWIVSQRKVYEPAYAAVLPDLADNRIPISNAGLEELIKSTIDPLFYKRSSFTSIERTNRLTDLAICASHFMLDDPLEVARRLRADAHVHEGCTTSPRSISDPTDPDTGRPYRSLRDRSLTMRLAQDRAVA